MDDVDFRFEIEPIEEPEMGCTHIVTMIENGPNGERLEATELTVLDRFTTDNPYGAVEAAREAQAYSLEERFDLYAEMGL